MTQLDSASELYCPGCGYDLRSIGSNRCPECGLTVDRSQLGQSIIPWLHREKLGRYRAFWRTVRLVSVSPRKLAHDMSCPARFRDAVLFRRLVALHVWIPIATLACLGIIFGDARIWVGSDIAGSVVQVITLLTALTGLWVWILMICGLPSYFFHPGALDVKRQNRAITLSYYGCAPLAWTPITLGAILLVVGMLFFIGGDPPVILIGAMWMFGFLSPFLQIADHIRALDALLSATTHSGLARRITLQLLFPIAAVVLGLLLVVGIPLAVGFVGVILISVTHRVP